MNVISIINNYLKLPNAEFLYNQFSELFYTKNDEISYIKRFKKINLSKEEFVYSCQEPITSGEFSLLALIFNYFYLFHYKLFGTTVTSLGLIFLYITYASFNLTIFPLLGIIAFSLILLMFFISNYSKVLYARKIYFELDKISKLNISNYNNSISKNDVVNKNPKHLHSYSFVKNKNLGLINVNKFSLKFKPFNFILTFFLGLPYIYLLTFIFSFVLMSYIDFSLKFI